jgi:hypothetical protein
VLATGRRTAAVDPRMAYRWARAAGEAARDVPAAGGEAADWTVRGWAEIALGCFVVGVPEGYQGLDDAVRASDVPCTGPHADRLRRLRGQAGRLPDCYAPPTPVAPTPIVPGPHDLVPAAPDAVPRPVREACLIMAGFCDAVERELIARGAPWGRGDDTTPVWTGLADHLRWGERYRNVPTDRSYGIIDVDLPASLMRRCWMRLPSADGAYDVLLRPDGRRETTVRQRVQQGVHNGAHLDHLAATRPPDWRRWRRSAPLEFGDGLLATEAYAMSIELIAVSLCTVAGRFPEAVELHRGLISRIGRIPGVPGWARHLVDPDGDAVRWDGAPSGSPALSRVCAEQDTEFAMLPRLAAQYVTGPLQLIASGWSDPLVPSTLARAALARWAYVCERFESAALLSERLAGRADPPSPVQDRDCGELVPRVVR